MGASLQRLGLKRPAYFWPPLSRSLFLFIYLFVFPPLHLTLSISLFTPLSLRPSLLPSLLPSLRRFGVDFSAHVLPAEDRYVYSAPGQTIKKVIAGMRQRAETLSGCGGLAAQKRALKRIFSMMDRDGSGAVSLAEFKAAAKSFALFGSHVDLLFATLDTDASQSIDLQELVDFVYPAVRKRDH